MSDYNSDVVSFQGSFFLNTANFGGGCSSNQESNPKDLIDYEKLIYIYINFLDNSEIKQRIEAIFSLISANLEIREKYKLKIL